MTDYGDENPLLMDYFGFQRELYELKFKSRGNAALSQRVVQVLKEVCFGGVACRNLFILRLGGISRTHDKQIRSPWRRRAWFQWPWIGPRCLCTLPFDVRRGIYGCPYRRSVIRQQS